MKEEDVIKFHEMMADVKAENRLNPVKLKGESKYAIKLPTLKKVETFDHYGNFCKRIGVPNITVIYTVAANSAIKFQPTPYGWRLITPAQDMDDEAEYVNIAEMNRRYADHMFV
jgi:hypothetical protein